MGKIITALKIQQKNKNRIAVFLDGEFGFGLSVLVASPLHIDQELSDEQISNLQKQDELEVAYLRADHFIAYRARTQLEVSRKLQQLGYSEGIIRHTLDRLNMNGLLDDRQFAVQWVDSRSASKPRGRRLLELELRQKGVDSETIENTLLPVKEDELSLSAGKAYASRLQGLDWIEFRRKLSQYLLRRGFDYSTILPVVSSIWADLDTKNN